MPLGEGPTPPDGYGPLLLSIYLSVQTLNEGVDALRLRIEDLASETDRPTEYESSLPAFPSSIGAMTDLVRHLFGGVLSETEVKVCACRVLGLSDSKIALLLFISRSTAKVHTAAILRKFDLNSAREIPFLVFRRVWERYRKI